MWVVSCTETGRGWAIELVDQRFIGCRDCVAIASGSGVRGSDIRQTREERRAKLLISRVELEDVVDPELPFRHRVTAVNGLVELVDVDLAP